MEYYISFFYFRPMGILPFLFASAFCAESSISALRHQVIRTFPTRLVDSGYAAHVTVSVFGNDISTLIHKLPRNSEIFEMIRKFAKTQYQLIAKMTDKSAIM